MSIIVSAPGKIFLMGEHAVVYGKPALLASVNKRLYVTVEKSKKNISINSQEPVDYVRHILEVVRQHYKQNTLSPFALTIKSQIPASYHLGSSAAVAVAVVAAVIYSLKKVWNPKIINQLAYEAEKEKHGTPSGADNTVVTYGGLIWYRKEFEYLRNIWQLPFKLPQKMNHFFLVDTGKPQETTAEMVAIVRDKYNTGKKGMEKIFNDNEYQVKQITDAVKNEDEDILVRSISEGEKTLEDMGVVSPKVTPFIRKIEDSGGAAKILGGGGEKKGVGYLLCYHRQVSRVRKICNHFGYKYEPIKLGEEGVRLESG